MTKEVEDLSKQIYEDSDQGDVAATLQVAAAQVLGRFLAEDFSYPPALLKTRGQVTDFRDLINVRARREPLANPASLGLLLDVIAYLDKYRPEALSVIVTGTDQLGEVTIIHASPPAPRAEEEEDDEDGDSDKPGQLVTLADHIDLRRTIRLRNLRAA